MSDPAEKIGREWSNTRALERRAGRAGSADERDNAKGRDVMKYVMLFASSSDETWGELTAEKREAVYHEIMAWWETHAAAGTILGGERLQGSATATTVRGFGAQAELLDGPFVESKEEVSGFSVIEAADLDAALALARTWPALQIPGESVEVRPVFEM
jgi:hypothetical protein